MTSIGLDPDSSYYDRGEISVLDIIEAKLTEEQFIGFLLGNLLKYSCRMNWKGCATRDAAKMRVYASKLEEKMKQREGA